MTPFKTMVRHDPPSTYGDCFAACIRSVTGIESFPHVLHDGCSADEQRLRANAWLKQAELAFMEYPMFATGVDRALEIGGHYTRFSRNFWVLSGSTNKGLGHYVVCHGGRVVHNPTEGAEIVRPNEHGAFWMGVIVQLL